MRAFLPAFVTWSIFLTVGAASAFAQGRGETVVVIRDGVALTTRDDAAEKKNSVVDIVYRGQTFVVLDAQVRFQYSFGQRTEQKSADWLMLVSRGAPGLLNFKDVAPLEKAEAVLTEQIRRNPKDDAALTGRARFYFQRQQYDKAITDATAALALQPGNAQALVVRSSAWRKKEDYGRAAFDAAQAIRLAPGLWEAYVARGDIEHNLTRYDQAIVNYSRVIELCPASAVGFSHRGASRAHKNDPREDDPTLQDLATATQLDPYDSIPHLGRTMVFSARKRNEDAILAFSEVIRLEPWNSLAYAGRSAMRMNTNDYAGAIADAEQAIKLNTRHPVAYFVRGSVNTEIGKLQEAIADFNHLLKLNPRSADAFFQRGKAFKKLGDQAQADRDFQAAAYLDPKFAGAAAELSSKQPQAERR